jgi:hypothetical protein
MNQYNIALAELGRDVVPMLERHGWTVSLKSASPSPGEAIVLIEVRRGAASRRSIYVRSTALSKSAFLTIDGAGVEVVLAGSLYKTEEFARDLKTPLADVREFPKFLFRWNAESCAGKRAPIGQERPLSLKPKEGLVVRSENPIEQVWTHLAQLKSPSLCAKSLARRFEATESTLQKRAEAMAYLVRNAHDYFVASRGQGATQRALNLYYGMVALAEAETLTVAAGPHGVEDVEKSTRAGHGLATADVDPQHPAPDTLFVAPLATGFFPKWVSLLGHDISSYPRRRCEDGARPALSVTLVELLARIPELRSIYCEVVDAAPLAVEAHYESYPVNPRAHEAFGATYVTLVDDTGRMTLETLLDIPGPLSEFQYLPSSEGGVAFRTLVSHPHSRHWHGAIEMHESPFSRQSLILPLFGSVTEYRIVVFVLLYALSIVVRYRPSLWRSIQEGPFEHYRNLISMFLDVVERLLPEQYLKILGGRDVRAVQPGSIFG